MSKHLVATTLFSGLGAEIEVHSITDQTVVWAYLKGANDIRFCVDVAPALSDEEIQSLRQEYLNSQDTDVFEIAEELYQALEIAVDALNQIPNTQLFGEHGNSYRVAAHIDGMLRTYKERI